MKNGSKIKFWKEFNFEDLYFPDYTIQAIDQEGNFFDHNLNKVWKIIFFHRNDLTSEISRNFQVKLNDLFILRISSIYFVDSNHRIDSIESLLNIVANKQTIKSCVRLYQNNVSFWTHGINCKCTSAFQNDLFFESLDSITYGNKGFDNKTIQIFLPPLSSKSGGSIAIRRLMTYLSKNNVNLDLRFYGFSPKDKVRNLGIPGIVNFSESSNSPLISMSFDTVTNLPITFDFNIKWNLNFPGALPNLKLGKYQASNSHIFNYSSILGTKVPRLFVNNIDFSLIQNIDSLPRSFNTLYLGKNESFFELPYVYQLIRNLRIDKVITRSWPLSKVELFTILKQTHNFYSFDPLSALNFEASLCGCKVILDNTFSPEINSNVLREHDIPMKNIFWKSGDEEGLNSDEQMAYLEYSKMLSLELEAIDMLNFVNFINSLN
jgi:hypothetical protein